MVTRKLTDSEGPIVAVSDWLTLVPDQIARWTPRPFHVLGTDGFGRSDTRESLRSFFEVDAGHLVVAVALGHGRSRRCRPERSGRRDPRP